MSKKIQNTSIRIISLISCVMVLISALIFPAAATDTGDVSSAYQPTFENLLDLATEYEMQAYKNGNLAVTQFMKDPIVQVNTSGYAIHFIWGDEYSRSYYDYILIGLQIPNPPVSVTFNDLTGTFLSQSDSICYYKVNFARTSLAKYDLYVDLGTNTGELKIVSCFGVIDSSIEISSVSLRTWGQLRSDGQYYMQTFFNDTVSVPYVYQKEFYETSPSVTPENMYIEVSVPVSLPYAESLSFTFTSPSVFPNDTNSSSLEGSSGVALMVNDSTVQALSYIVTHVTTLGTYQGQAQYLQTVTVDLSGIDLTGDCEIVFRLYMSPSPLGYVAGTGQFYRFQIYKIGIKEALYMKPWYMRFFYWIQAEFMSLRSHLDRNFESLKDKLDSVFGVDETPPDTSDQQQQIEDSVDDMDQMGDEFENAQQEMDELMPNMPSWDETGLEGFDTIVVSYIDQFRPVFLAIYDNNIISQILTYTFLFALGGFILFGER